jgi:hypothetical protein
VTQVTSQKMENVRSIPEEMMGRGVWWRASLFFSSSFLSFFLSFSPTQEESYAKGGGEEVRAARDGHKKRGCGACKRER